MAGQAPVDEVEPLAADVRPITGDSPRRLKRMAKLKLISTVLGCRFDDLRQRDQERRTRRLSLLVLVLGLLVIGVTALALYARAQQLRADREAKVATAQRLAAQARVHFTDRLDLAALLAAEASLLDHSTAVTASLLDSLEHDARLQTFLRGHTAPIQTLTFSRDGQLMASGGDDRTIRLWNARTWEPLAELKNAHPKPISSLAFSPDGSMLASAGETVRLWNVASRTPIGWPLAGHTEPVYSVVFDRTGTVLLSSGRSEMFRWNIRAVPPSATRFGNEDGFAGNLALSPDGHLLAIGSGQSIVSLWNADTGQRLHENLTTDGVFVQSLAFGPNGSVLAATDDFGLTLWDLSGARPEPKELADDVDFLLAVAISPDGKWLAAGGNDTRVRLWNLETNRQLARPLIGHTGFVTAVAFHPGGGTFVSGSEDGTMIVWTPEPASRVRQYLDHPGRVLSAAFSGDDRLLATGSFDGTIIVWDLASGRPVKRRTIATDESVDDLVFAAGDSLLACHGGEQLRRWNVNAERPGGTVVPGGCSDAPFTNGGTVRAQLSPSSEPGEIDQESDYTITVSPLEGGSARPRTATVRFKWNRESFAVSGDGHYAAAGTDNGTAYLWNLQTDPPERRELGGHAGRIRALAFSADGAVLATGGHDANIRLWNVSSGALRQPPREAAARVERVQFNRSGTRLAALYISTREPPALQLWDVVAGIPIGSPLWGTERQSIGNVVAFSPNGRWVVAGGDDDRILLLDTDVATWRAQACRFANRNLSPTEEWPIYFPGQPYHKTCPDLPLPITIPRIRHDQEEELF